MRRYNPGAIEKKWQGVWAKQAIYKTPDKARGKENRFLLVEFPYPSGNLHVGHWYAFAVPDMLARMLRMQGKNVMYPIGFDAFGLPAENAAIKNKLNPRKWTLGNIAYMKKQIRSMGTSFDWSREVVTCDPAYYKWTQWLFLQLFKKGLVKRKETAANWCPKCKTVLANEQVVTGKCERCGTEVVQKMMLQWNIGITEYADRLVDDLDALDWPEQIKESQRNWIGRTEGAEIDFPLDVGKKYKFVILHGFQSGPDRPRWVWAKKKLEEMGHEVILPALPHTNKPSEEEWISAALKCTQFDDRTVLVGHSLGAVAALKVLEKLKKPIARLVTVGGFVDPEMKDRKETKRSFYNTWKWTFDRHAIRRNARSITLLHDPRDYGVTDAQAQRLSDVLGVPITLGTSNKPHFTGDTEPDVVMWLRPTIRVFTTRPDTLFGATYLVLAPEHPWVTLALQHKTVLKNNDEVQAYVTAASKKTELERMADQKEKTGVRLEGVEAVNPATGERIPLYVADYVLAHYGTGAIMAVPAHDERDMQFAEKFKLPIRQVIRPVFKPENKRSDSKFRETVSAFVRNDKGEVLMLKWKEYNWLTGVIGGMEKGEAAAQTAVREVLEETGYRTKALFVSPITVESHYFAEHKNEWRSRLDHPVLLELESNERGPVSAGELAKHESRWIKIEDALGMEMFKNNKLALELSLGRLSAYSEQRSTERPMLVNSGIYDGLSPEEAKTKMTDAFGRRKTTYKLRDWIVSRQRYWGVPIPIIHCPKCGAVPVPEKDLPVKLPEVTDYLPEGSGKSPLAKVKKWVETECPSCREKEKAPKYLIFDFDGVIGDTRKQNILARIAMGEAKNWKESEAMMLKYFSTKPWHSRGKHFTTAHKKRHKDWTYRYGVEVLKMKFKLFDGFVKEIRKLKNMKIAVVSAGHEMYSRGPLEKSGIRYTHFLAGNHDHSKETKIERVVRDWGVDLKDVYYFTDTTADVYELENLLDRKRIIGCSWGYVGEKVLREALPKEQILTAFSDIHRLWKPTMGERETDTLDTFVDSSWYYLRYTDPKNTKKFADMKKMDAWMPVDLYSGGAEHTTMHVLYSRFWQKALFDIGLVKNHEPYARRMNRSIILGPDGQKMSKSRGNVIDPDEVVKRLGTDTVRMYLAFIGPYNEVANYPWNPDGVVGVRRFLERVWRAQEIVEKKDAPALDPLLHKTIKKVGEDIPALKFNTAISQLMIFQNAVEKAGTIGKKQWNTLLKLLAPFAPHLAEELWHAGGGKKSVHLEKWPAHDLKLLVEESMTLAVQINGKTRGEVIVPSDATKETQEEAARTAVASRLAGKTVRRSVVVPGRLVNFVIS